VPIHSQKAKKNPMGFRKIPAQFLTNGFSPGKRGTP
jgi:hypothetical protein